MITLQRKNYSAKTKILAGLGKVVRGTQGIKKGLDVVASNPGKYINKTVIAPSIKAPISATALQIAPIPGSSLLISKAAKLEEPLWKKLGLGDKMKKASNEFANSKTARYIESGINTAITSLKGF